MTLTSHDIEDLRSLQEHPGWRLMVQHWAAMREQLRDALENNTATPDDRGKSLMLKNLTLGGAGSPEELKTQILRDIERKESKR